MNAPQGFNFEFVDFIGDMCFIDSKVLVTGEDKMIRIWDLRDAKEEVKAFKQH